MAMSSLHFDVVIIGAGPGGEAAAINLAQHGKRVAMIENRTHVGGGCTHSGTIPSKALRHSVRRTIQFNTDPMFRSIGEPRIFTFQEVLDRAEKTIHEQVDIRTDFYAYNRINLIFGHARFVDKNTVSVITNKGAKELHISADHFVVAVGSHPYRPPDVDFTHPRIYCSDSILKMKYTPRSIIVYGAGVIGCEYASIFAGLGVRVDLVNGRDRLLSFLDDEIADALGYEFRRNGVRLRHNEEYQQVEATDDYVTLSLKSGKLISANALLWCNGRTGNTQSLGLENIGVEADGRGQLKVDKCFRTKLKHIYAVGDVIGWPSLASASYDQGRAASLDMLGKVSYWDGQQVPTGIYTIPEISSVGRTERELTAAKIPYEVGQAHFKDIARAQITGEYLGMLKILFHSETLEILGIHCFGDQAAEIVHIGQAIMSQQGEANTLKYFTGHTFNYPTMAEAYRVAALDGLNRVRHRIPDKWDMVSAGIEFSK